MGDSPEMKQTASLRERMEGSRTLGVIETRYSSQACGFCGVVPIEGDQKLLT